MPGAPIKFRLACRKLLKSKRATKTPSAVSLSTGVAAGIATAPVSTNAQKAPSTRQGTFNKLKSLLKGNKGANDKVTNAVVATMTIVAISPAETSDVDSEVALLKAEVEEYKNTADQAKTNACNKAAELSQYMADVSQSIEIMETVAEREDAKLREANAKLLEADVRVKAVDAQLKSTNTKIKMLETQLQAADTEVEDMNAKLKNAQDVESDLRERILALEQSSADTASQLKQTILELKDSETIVAALTQDPPEDLITALKKEKESREMESKAFVKEKKDLTYKLKASKQATNAALLRHIELEQNARSARSEVVDLEKAHRELEKNNAILSAELEKLKMSAVLAAEIPAESVGPEGLADLPFFNVTDTWLLALFNPLAHDKETGYETTPRDEPLLARILRSDFDRLSMLISAFIANQDVDGRESRYHCTTKQSQNFHLWILQAMELVKQLLGQNVAQTQEIDGLRESRAALYHELQSTILARDAALHEKFMADSRVLGVTAVIQAKDTELMQAAHKYAELERAFNLMVENAVATHASTIAASVQEEKKSSSSDQNMIVTEKPSSSSRKTHVPHSGLLYLKDLNTISGVLKQRAWNSNLVQHQCHTSEGKDLKAAIRENANVFAKKCADAAQEAVELKQANGKLHEHNSAMSAQLREYLSFRDMVTMDREQIFELVQQALHAHSAQDHPLLGDTLSSAFAVLGGVVKEHPANMTSAPEDHPGDTNVDRDLDSIASDKAAYADSTNEEDLNAELESSISLQIDKLQTSSSDSDEAEQTGGDIESTTLKFPDAEFSSLFDATQHIAIDENSAERTVPVLKFGSSSTMPAFSFELTVPQEAHRPVRTFTFSTSTVVPRHSIAINDKSATQTPSHDSAATNIFTFGGQDNNTHPQIAAQGAAQREVSFDFTGMTSTTPVEGVFFFSAGGARPALAVFSAPAPLVESAVEPQGEHDTSTDESLVGVNLLSSSSPIAQTPAIEDSEGEVTSLTSLASDDKQVQEESSPSNTKKQKDSKGKKLSGKQKALQNWSKGSGGKKRRARK